jgi:asparagine synthase (glutamine-hydrolysing)
MNKEEQLAALIQKAVQKVIADDIAILLSGGIDSSLLAYVASKQKSIVAYTVGVENSYDFKAADSAARLLGINANKVIIKEKDVNEGIIELINIDPSQDALELSFNLPLYFVCKSAKEKILLTGQGSDEVFGGYKKYKTEPMRMKEDLNKVLNSTIVKEIKIANYFKKDLKTPYLDPEILAFSKSLPDSDKISSDSEKIILRKAAIILGLPEEIAARKKKAAQYGSGINKILKKLAKDKNQEIHQYISTLKNKI